MRYNSAIVFICVIGFLALLKHILILPVIDWENHEVTGVEFKIRF